MLSMIPASLLVASALFAQDGKTISVAYTDGSIHTVEVLGLEDDTATLRLFIMGGSMDVKRKLSAFEAPSAFRIVKEATKPETFEQHFDLAKTAAGYHLLRQAGEEARAAVAKVEGTPDAEAKTLTLRKWAADTLEAWIGEAVKEGKTEDAEHYLKLLATRLADLRNEEQLDALAAAVEGLQQADEKAKQDARQKKLDDKQRAEIERRMKPIDRAVKKGDEYLRKAISSSRQWTQSTNNASKAVDAYKAAWKDLEKLQKKYPDDADFSREAESIAQHIHDDGIRAALHAANMLTVRSDYKGAMDWANRVLAFDPGNAEAKEMVRTIQIAGAAASSNWGWGWGVGARNR